MFKAICLGVKLAKVKLWSLVPIVNYMRSRITWEKGLGMPTGRAAP